MSDANRLWRDRKGDYYRGRDGTTPITRSRAAQIAGGPAKLRELEDAATATHCMKWALDKGDEQ